MHSVSDNFKASIKDMATEKSVVIMLNNDVMFTDEDFASTVVFDDWFCTDEDLSFGQTPSDTVSFSVFSGGGLSGYTWEGSFLWLYAGTQTASESYVFGDGVRAHIEIAGEEEDEQDVYVWECRDDGLYLGNTLVDSGVYNSLVSMGGGNLIAIGDSSAIWGQYNATEWFEFTATAYMARKFRTPQSLVLQRIDDVMTGMYWDGTAKKTFEYVEMGTYPVHSNNITIDRATGIVSFSDVHDLMVENYDVDASEFISSLTYPITLGGIYEALMAYVNENPQDTNFPNYNTTYTSSPFADSACTLRDVLGWIAEKAHRIATMQKYDIPFTRLKWIDPTPVESLGASDISQSGFQVAEYSTTSPTGVLIKSNSGASLQFGDDKSLYSIYGNPFVSTITNAELEAYKAIPSYVPMQFTVLEADPSVEVGDIINVQPLIDDYQILTDAFGTVYAEWQEWVALYGHDDVVVGNENHAYGIAKEGYVAYAYEAPVYPVPLMHRELRYDGGGFTAIYEATGNQVRKANTDTTAYNANVAAQKAVEKIDNTLTQQEVFNRLTNNGQTQGIYLQDGKIYINAEYIATGILASPNGKYSLNMLTGEVNMASANITGGSIHIETSSETIDIIKLDHTLSRSWMASNGFSVWNKSGAGSPDTSSNLWGSGLYGYSGVGSDGSIANATLRVLLGWAASNASMTMYSDSGVLGMQLTNTLLRFFDGNAVSATYFPNRESGVVYSWSVAANSTATQTISFSRTFAHIPRVWVQSTQSADNAVYGSCSFSVYNITTTGFTVRAFNNTSSTVGMPFMWMTF